MPFANRDKPRLIERLRGKSGQDLFNEVKSALNSDSRRMFFDSQPSWSNRGPTFSRGFPFDDDEPRSGRSFLERERRDRPFADRDSFFTDRAAGFAETQHEPPWDEDRRSKKRVPEQDPPTQPAPSPLSQHGLRNTVPFAQQPSTERPARAMSAPPGERQPRFTSTCEIPIMGDAPVPPAPQPQQAPAPAGSNNVRLIPIQVEGRDKPLVNSNIDTSTNFAAEAPAFDARLPRDFGPFRKHSSRFQQSPPQQQQQQHPQQQQQNHPQQQQPPQQKPQPQPQKPQQQPPQQQRPPSRGSDEPDRPAPPDPVAMALARIAEVQREVEALAVQVETATVASRKDKQYVYLDEMLTRQLLRLDDVDPAGQDTIRQARRDAIKAIQKCISVLESKVPGEAMEVDPESVKAEAEQAGGDAEAEPMAVTTESQEVPPASDPAPPSADPPA